MTLRGDSLANERSLIVSGFEFLAFWSGVFGAVGFLTLWFTIYGGINGLTSTVFLGFRLHHAVLGAFLDGLAVILLLQNRSNFFASIFAFFIIGFSTTLIVDDFIWHYPLCQPLASNNFTCPAPFL